MKTTLLGWFCSCASIIQQMFCSQKKSLHRLRVEQALSLVLTGYISFGSWCQGPGQPPRPPWQGRAGLYSRPALLGAAAQLWLRLSKAELCESWEKEGPVGLVLGAVPKLSPCPHGLPKPQLLCRAVTCLTEILTRGLRVLAWSQVILMTWACLVVTVTDLAAVSGPHPDLAMLTWLPDLTSDLPDLCGLVWLTEPVLPNSSSLGTAPLVGEGTAPSCLAPYFAFSYGAADPWQLVVLQFSLLTF